MILNGCNELLIYYTWLCYPFNAIFSSLLFCTCSRNCFLYPFFVEGEAVAVGDGVSSNKNSLYVIYQLNVYYEIKRHVTSPGHILNIKLLTI